MAAKKHKDVTPVLKWVQKSDEAEIKAAFARTLTVRTKGPEARDLADQYFFENLVRVHRAGEGALYTGLKPAGTPLASPVAEANQALATGAVDNLTKLVTQDAAAGIRKRFADAQAKKPHAAHNGEAGRAFVAACVEYVHCVATLVAGLAALAGLWLSRAKTVALWCSSSVLALTPPAAALMAWTANLGGKVRHTKIRGSAPRLSILEGSREPAHHHKH